MNCAWKELLTLLPQWMRKEVDRLGKDTLQELRLRVNAPPELVLCGKVIWIAGRITQEDLQVCLQSASRFSPWSAESVALGYVTAQGGHRIGLCGQVVIHNGCVTGIRNLTSVCIRVARDFSGIGNGFLPKQSTLILGAPGWGKTTLLRDLSRTIAKQDTVAVVDEREELFPDGFDRGKRMDVLSGCPKVQGIQRVLRTMGPNWIAVDEITEEGDCAAMIQAMGCGVKLLATCHAASREDFLSREIYKSLCRYGVFTQLMILNQQKQWRLERMNQG